MVILTNWRKPTEHEANGWEGWLEVRGSMARMKKVGDALTGKDLVHLTKVKILSLKRRPKVCAMSTKQTSAAN